MRDKIRDRVHEFFIDSFKKIMEKASQSHKITFNMFTSSFSFATVASALRALC